MKFEWPHEVGEFIESCDERTSSEIRALLSKLSREHSEFEPADQVRVAFVVSEIYIYYAIHDTYIEVPNIGRLSDLPWIDRCKLTCQRDAMAYHGTFFAPHEGEMVAFPGTWPPKTTAIKIGALGRSLKVVKTARDLTERIVMNSSSRQLLEATSSERVHLVNDFVVRNLVAEGLSFEDLFECNRLICLALEHISRNEKGEPLSALRDKQYPTKHFLEPGGLAYTVRQRPKTLVDDMLERFEDVWFIRR